MRIPRGSADFVKGWFVGLGLVIVGGLALLLLVAVL